jgi:hypothetical protein
MAFTVHLVLFWLRLLLASDKWPPSVAGNYDEIAMPRGAVTQIQTTEMVIKLK